MLSRPPFPIFINTSESKDQIQLEKVILLIGSKSRGQLPLIYTLVQGVDITSLQESVLNVKSSKTNTINSE